VLTLHTFALFMTAALALNLTPGPDMAFIMAQAASKGTRAGLTAALGISTGALVHIAMAAFGLAALLAAFPLAFTILRYAGAAYLVWIAVGMLLHPPHLTEGKPGNDAAATFRQGMLTNITNPKVAMFFIAFLPQFVMPGPMPAWQQLLILGLALNISGTVVDCLVALGGGALATRLRRTPIAARIVGWFSASGMLALALRLALPDRR
jgi:threonine/homoserine/homoserine lactone efflux protein